MAVTLKTLRRFALSLPGTTEAPHHQLGSFRVRGRIFATFPADQAWINVFLPDDRRDLALAMDAEFLQPLRWGGRVVGVRADLAQARSASLRQWLRVAHAHKAGSGPDTKRGGDDA